MRSHRFATWIPWVAALAGGCGGVGGEAPAPPAFEGRLSRTEFTETVENFFEYDPLRAGRESQFLIHLTVLAEGGPLAGAEVDVRILSRGRSVAESRARPGKVDGIYVAELTPPAPGDCELEFRIRSEVVDDRMLLSGCNIE